VEHHHVNPDSGQMDDRSIPGRCGRINTFEAAYAHLEVDPTQYADIYENPKTFDEAWNHPDPFQREKWREGINTGLLLRLQLGSLTRFLF
jgi:hypothetical protein